jgi:DNA mismatch repair ATPase MutS
LIGLAISGKIQKTYILLSKLEPVVFTLYKQLDYFEKENFDDSFLSSLKSSLADYAEKSASSSIKKLQQILGRFDVRLNLFAFFILNTFCLWDLWQIIALNEWRKVNKLLVSNWFNAIAQLEVAGSFAVLGFNNDNWCFPKIADEHFTLSGKAIGHPLILKQQSVTNSFSIAGIAKIDLITGSNMAGKSTFLRSLGVNIILAYAGSCVCAEAFTVSVAELMSSMRIEDNLAENTSTFYAELKKIKSIIDAVNEERNLFILLDEILRGTNSLDRHTGSKALIQQLIKKHAIAVIATHDIELSKLENDFQQSIKNYHFDVQVNGDKLFFDYKLKDGICQSMNASVLMKQIGIEM